MQLDLLYSSRFDARDEAFKARMWAILWRRVFSRWIGREDVLLDVGGGYCELANAAHARRRIVVDLNPHAPRYAAPGVEVHLASAEEMGFLADREVDVVFSSNFFEHLPDKGSLTRVLGEIRRVLKPGGRLLAVGPNVRLMPGSYWDYYDHHLPLSERSLAEALLMCGFTLERVDPRFLPGTTRSSLPRWPWLVEAWLALRPLSSLFTGRQFLVVARRPAEDRRAP